MKSAPPPTPIMLNKSVVVRFNVKSKYATSTKFKTIAIELDV